MKKMEKEEIKKRLNRAFKLMRKKGLIARQNFLCCQSCGLSKIDEMITTRKNIIGYCFYHGQDREDFKAGHNFYMAFGGINKEMTAKEIGTLICNCLEETDVRYSWNGDKNTRIKIYGFEKAD